MGRQSVQRLSRFVAGGELNGRRTGALDPEIPLRFHARTTRGVDGCRSCNAYERAPQPCELWKRFDSEFQRPLRPQQVTGPDSVVSSGVAYASQHDALTQA